MRRALLIAGILLTSLHAYAEEKRLLVSGIFADSSIVGPLVRYTAGDPAGTEYAVGITGWIIDGQWIRHQTPSRALIVSADITPFNAHFSDHIYVDGERARDLEYEDASYRLRAGLRLKANERSTTDIQLVGLVEQLDEIDNPAVEAFWDQPFFGVDVAHTYQLFRSENPLLSIFDGLAISARAEVLTGEETWSRFSVSERAARQFGKVHLRQSIVVMSGKSLNVVNRFVVAGSWDALGENAIYGFRFGEFRIARGVIANAGGDYTLPRNWRAGVRASYLRSDVDDTYGAALNVAKQFGTVGANMGVGVPRDGDPIVYLSVIAPLYAKGYR